MTAKEILEEIKPLGSDSYKRVMFNHGVKEPCFGVKISDLQKIVKRIKKDYQLALDLYDTGNYDAMYLAGLIADDARMTKKDLQRWVAKATHGALSGSTVAWVAAGSPHGWELALEWIDSKKPLIAVAGWATLGSLVSIKDDAELDLAELKRLLQRVQKTIHQAPNAVRYADELVCHRGRLLRAAADRYCHPDRREDRPGHGGHGQHLVSGALCPGLHPQGAETRHHREEAQDGEMLND